MPDYILGSFFRKAEKELNEVAKKYGFTIELHDLVKDGTWAFIPIVDWDWKPPAKEDNNDKTI